MKTQQTVHEQARTKMNEMATLVDEVVALDAELEPWKEKIKRLETAKQELRAHLEGAPADEGLILKGSYGEVEYTKCRVEKLVVDKKRLVRLIGRAVFDHIAHIPLVLLEQHLTKRQLESVTEDFYGSRALKAIRNYGRTVH